MKFEIKSGFLSEIKEWRIEKRLLVGTKSALMEVNVPVDCISAVVKLEELNKDVYVEIFFTNGERSVVKASKKVAAFLYELQFSSKKVHFKLTEKSMLPQIAIGIGAVVVILAMMSNSGSNSGQSVELSPLTKVALCREYIGETFGKPVDIIKGSVLKDGSIFVGYVREEDSTSWMYSCNFYDNKMVWAGWFDDEKKLGRWRTEDEVTLQYNDASNSVSFRMDNREISVKMQ